MFHPLISDHFSERQRPLVEGNPSSSGMLPGETIFSHLENPTLYPQNGRQILALAEWKWSMRVSFQAEIVSLILSQVF